MEGSAASLRHLMTSPSTEAPHHFKPTTNVFVPQNHLQSYWASINATIDTHLRQAIQVRPPILVHEPMHYLVFSTPKTMAPALTVAACELVGGQPDKAIPTASALHLMHTASLLQQRLPLSDRHLGANQDSDHHPSYPAGIELLTGDGILSFGYELLARPSDHHRPDDDEAELILKVITEITRAMGSQGMVKEQYLQMRCSGSDDDEKKEGLVYGCGAACGAILGGATEEERESLRRFGRYAGMIHGKMKSTVGDHGVEQKELVVERLRSLALKELECFIHKPCVEAISSILHC